ncbi:anti-sigma factor domain-containing protein [Citreimonas sp.]|uniref:anti-sigma factor n=1 Tax=Citreimonas sp. TaxID=3036715 RepID=UPI0035C7E01D
MSADDDTDLPGGREAAAAEYALGLLSDDEARAFEARLREDPALEAEVVAWEESFAAFTDSVDPVAPPERVWRRIEAARFAPAGRRGFWRQLLPYAIGAVAGAVIAFVVSTADLLQQQSPLIFARLEPVESQLAFAVQIDPPTHTISVELDAGSVPDDGALQLWLIPEGEAPISLGVMSPGGDHVVVLSDAMALQVRGGVLAVSLEPPGGSPTGAPTGPVQAAGVPIPS